ncbi:putative kinase [Crossiella equi]|uniref:Kinase n=1 Tax=Crossiella equi TaxID=130796 RepID=A0ABS5AKW0_9PSEU|nr:AAA family ATPase [Crossiella equi]MBP2477051.1 putative kinase [Crossiella equi]
MVVRVGRRDLLLLAGLPGAGKSSLLRKLRATGPYTVLDSDQVRDPLGERLPRVPYRCYRPLVHLLHHLRIVHAALTTRGPVLVHEPATRVFTRTWLSLLARLTGRTPRMLWLEVTAEQARAGQRARARVIPAQSFAKHVRRALRISARLATGRPLRGWPEATVVYRQDVADGLKLELVGSAPR